MGRKKKWPEGTDIELTWVLSRDWQNELAKESNSSMPEFTLTLIHCHWPNCSHQHPLTNEHGYVMIARGNNKEVGCGTHAKMDLRVCNNRLCGLCEHGVSSWNKGSVNK